MADSASLSMALLLYLYFQPQQSKGMPYDYIVMDRPMVQLMPLGIVGTVTSCVGISPV